MITIQTPNAPAAIGPYAQAIAHNGLVYTSGQIALSPETGSLVGNNVKEQTEQCLKNLHAVLTAAGSNTESIIKVLIFLKTMDDFPIVNSVYENWVGNHRPARSTVAVAGLPKGALIEIECVAVVTEADRATA